MILKLVYESDYTVNENTFIIKIGPHQYPYTVNNNQIVVSADIPFGFHLLSIVYADLNSNESVKLTNAIVNGSSLRHTLYLAFCPKSGQRFNTTTLNKYNPELILPFGNPVSWWIAECARNFKSNVYGRQLEDEYVIYYPESIEIEGNYISVMPDFFKYNLGFTAIPKEEFNNPWHNRKIPALRLPNFKFDEQALLNEYMNNIHLFEESEYIFRPPQNNYLDDEIDFDIDQTVSVPWQLLKLQIAEEKFDYSNVLPETAKIKEQLENSGCRIGLSFLGLVHPNSFVSPHLDDYASSSDYFVNQQGLTKIFIPVGWKSGNYYKFDRVGLIPHDQGAWMTNTNSFTHASINLSDSLRFTLAFNLEIYDPEKFKKYL